jgi:hypothetical protein
MDPGRPRTCCCRFKVGKITPLLSIDRCLRLLPLKLFVTCHDSMAGRLSVQTLQLQIHEGAAANHHLIVMLLSGFQKKKSVVRRSNPRHWDKESRTACSRPAICRYSIIFNAHNFSKSCICMCMTEIFRNASLCNNIM